MDEEHICNSCGEPFKHGDKVRIVMPAEYDGDNETFDEDIHEQEFYHEKCYNDMLK